MNPTILFYFILVFWEGSEEIVCNLCSRKRYTKLVAAKTVVRFRQKYFDVEYQKKVLPPGVQPVIEFHEELIVSFIIPKLKEISELR